jgi:8-oxo-dGTP diphosphatase
MRDQIRVEVASISPLDQVEAATQLDVLSWIDSGVELCRLRKPAVPPKHLVSYFAVVDGDHLLLVDHIKAQLWLPSGGHVEPGEHPRAAVVREAIEELSIEAEFLFERPLLLTSTTTVGATAGHTDVSLWYVLKGDRRKSFEFDRGEFRALRWFHRDDIPMHRTDPEMRRFLAKLDSFET